MPKPSTSSAKNAPTVRQGHTTTNRYGADVNARVRGGSKGSDLKR